MSQIAASLTGPFKSATRPKVCQFLTGIDNSQCERATTLGFVPTKFGGILRPLGSLTSSRKKMALLSLTVPDGRTRQFRICLTHVRRYTGKTPLNRWPLHPLTHRMTVFSVRCPSSSLQLRLPGIPVWLVSDSDSGHGIHESSGLVVRTWTGTEAGTPSRITDR